MSKTNLSDEQAEELMYLLQTVDRFENIGDIMENDMVNVGIKRIDENIVVSKATMNFINKYHQQVACALLDTVEVVANEDVDAIKRVRRTKGEIASLALETAQHGIERLTADEPNRLKTYNREQETIEHMDRIYRICRRIAGSAPTKVSEVQPTEAT